ncbi:hypothetical protein [Alicyclobacillus shizuokensis]|uniref:hypothetical protein n=1 Tax=Alicyclobacillus shizuokensis TaxID=392014 RepID=UPI0008365EC6|nr:hypothetical protein [Alicyclobacillus shizuokensis]
MSKRFRVTVEFAHGVRHTFDGLTPEQAVSLEEWAQGYDDDIVTTKFNGKTYYLNRDYLCSMVVEEAEGE